jgi:osmotically-inducible protein OsmY
MLALTAALAFSVAGVACDRSAKDAREDAAEAQKDANAAQSEADRKAQEARAEAREEAKDAARTAAEPASRLGAASETVDIKAALTADKTVDASDINVDTYAETKTVVLRGSVPTQAQKDLAARIAQREAVGFKIDNQLLVKPRS